MEESFHPAYVWVISIVVALGGLLFGYDWVVIGGAKPFYEQFFHLNSASQQGWAMSSALTGCLFGAVFSGVFSDKFGRKPLLCLASLVFVTSSFGTALANTLLAFSIWRIFGGFAIGMASMLAPMYISEVAPARLRGRLVSVNQFTIVIGMLLAQVVNWLIARPVPADFTAQQIFASWNGQVGWRWMFGVTAIPGAFFFAASCAVPESPRWLVNHGAPDKALQILARIGGGAYAVGARSEIESSLRETSAVSWKVLVSRRMAKPLLLGIVLAVLQQWCGINVIFNYAQEIFTQAGYGLSGVLSNIVITGVVLVLFTLVAMATVDKLGRRTLMLSGCAGLTVIYALLGFLYRVHHRGVTLLLFIVAAIAFYAMSLAPITWVLISEIFPNRVRGMAMSVAVASLWIACFVVTFSFPLLNSRLGPADTFWVYATVCMAGFVFTALALPETKGMTLEEIERSWAL